MSQVYIIAEELQWAKQHVLLIQLKSQVGLLQTAHSWASAGVLLGAQE